MSNRVTAWEKLEVFYLKKVPYLPYAFTILNILLVHVTIRRQSFAYKLGVPWIFCDFIFFHRKREPVTKKVNFGSTKMSEK